VKPWVGPPRGKTVSAQIAIPRELSRLRLVNSLIGDNAATSGVVIAHTCDELTSGSVGLCLTSAQPGADRKPGGGGAEEPKPAAAIAPAPIAPSRQTQAINLSRRCIVKEYERERSTGPLGTVARGEGERAGLRAHTLRARTRTTFPGGRTRLRCLDSI
jgi:hypothetical protein